VSESTSVRIQHWLDRLKAGDATAHNELIQCACHRLEAIVDKALGRFPGVRRFERGSDVLQNAVLRIRTNLLKRQLQDEVPGNPREFFALASCWIRDEIVALLRHYYGPLGEGANTQPSPVAGAPAEAAADSTADPNRLSRWTQLHDQINKLDPEQRELFGLMWYHGLSLKDAAEVLQISERTAKRRWREVRLSLHESAGDILE
jgi:RNA polymerase sigma factor (sigma-70 family)